MRHYFSLISKRTILDDATRHLKLLSEEEVDDLYQGYFTHYVKLDVGCPSQQQTVIVDTGSATTGFPCSECNECGEEYHINEFFAENESSCFRQIPCAECEIGYICLGSGAGCRVIASYAEGSSWSGYEAEDLFAVGGTPDEEQFSFRFACQTAITGLFITQLADGILGMNKGRSSLWRQMFEHGATDKEQFSLCYSLQQSFQTNAGVMVLGGVDTRLHDNPMTFARDTRGQSSVFFALTVNKIYLRTGVGDSIIPKAGSATVQEIDIPRAQRPIVDSGTTFTYLNRDLREPFEQAWSAVTNRALTSSLFLSEEEVMQLPIIIFQVTPSEQQNPAANALAGDLDPLNPSDALVAFPPSRYVEKSHFGSSYQFRLYFSEYGSGVLGANFIAGHDVFFDVENSRIGFAESKCDRGLIDWNTTWPPTASPEPTLAPTSLEPTSTGPPTTPPTTDESAAQEFFHRRSSSLVWAPLVMLWLHWRRP